MTRTPERRKRSRRAPAMLSALSVTLMFAALLAPGYANAAAPLSWSAPAAFDAGGNPSGVSCTSESLCVAVDHQGNALATSNPTAADPSWIKSPIDSGQSLNAVSCAPGGPCVAVDGQGSALVSSNPGATSWSSPEAIDAGRALTAVSCPSASLCVAVDEEGNVLTSTRPSAGAWITASSHPGHHLTSVSCSSPTLCVAVDSSGNALASTDPTGNAGEWHVQRIDAGELLAVSCAPGSSCVALDSAGNALASVDAGASAPTWSETSIDGERLTAVSCASSGLCVAVDGHGEALASDDATAPVPAWSASSADTGPPAQSLAGVSCLPGGFCMAVDAAGRWVAARVPAPGATTLKPSAVTSAGATLAGAVNPNDAVLGACSFEYGISSAYTQAVPCSVLPAAGGTVQEVSATLSGLAANTTYHYRVLAASPSGTTAGSDEAFTTAVNSQVAIVRPNPSITGTPANGQKLTCHPGTPAETTAQLSYAWLRDLIPIAGATASTYTVKGQDTGHHLQCQVTATDAGGSATANSAFVTIPVGGVPASAGETAVGTAAFKNGRLSVPIVCSTQAAGGCRVNLRLTAVETLSGSRIVAVAARSTRAGHKSAADLRRVNITLASVHAHLARGAHTTLTAVLDAKGRRLLDARRHFSAYLSVSGTVIGVIEAQLEHKLLTLTASSHSASTRATRRR